MFRANRSQLGCSEDGELGMTVGHVAASFSVRWGGPVAVLEGLLPLMASSVTIRMFAPVVCRSGNLDTSLYGIDVWSARAGALSRIWTGYGYEVRNRALEFIAGCDVIHIHELWHYPHYVVSRAARRCRVPVVVTPHGALEPWALRYKRARKELYSLLFQRRALQRATFVQALTQREADAIARFGVTRERIRIIPNGLPRETVMSLNQRDRHSSGGSSMSRGYGLFLGRIHPQKGLDLLVRSLPLLVARYRNVRIVVAGPDEGGHQSDIERLARLLGVRDRLTFTGLVQGEEKWRLLLGANFFVLPSYSEGFSMALLEALAVGLPVVATKVCEIGTLGKREAAILVDPLPEALAAGVDLVLSHPILAQRLGENAKRLVLERYTWEAVAEQMLQLYEEAIELQKAQSKWTRR